MKVLMINGSPNEKGCTYTALKEISDTLSANDVMSEIFWVGKEAVSGCLGCKSCAKTGACFMKDKVNQLAERLGEFDGLIVGSPVHYAAASGHLTAFLDRLFYSSSGKLKFKPGAAVVSCRRGGASAAFDQLNKYFTISSMPIVSSQYWNQVHGSTPEEVEKDLEGMQTMRTLANNMAWLLKCIEAGKNAGIEAVCEKEKIRTNFIR